MNSTLMFSRITGALFVLSFLLDIWDVHDRHTRGYSQFLTKIIID